VPGHCFSLAWVLDLSFFMKSQTMTNTRTRTGTSAPTEAITVPTVTPPHWFNAVVTGLLRTPGIERFLGRALALITFTGTKTGRTYTTPVSYYREGDEVVVITKRFRRWWRNLADGADVVLRLAGQTWKGRARARVGDESQLLTLTSFLEHRPRDARAYGLRLDENGRADPARARALLPQLVVIRIALSTVQ
jgi:F420H(2)-dependent quinone reductase